MPYRKVYCVLIDNAERNTSKRYVIRSQEYIVVIRITLSYLKRNSCKTKMTYRKINSTHPL